MNGVRFSNLSVPVNMGQSFVGGASTTFGIADPTLGNDSVGANLPLIDPLVRDSRENPDLTHEDDFHEDYDFSDEVLRYINQILMEEEVDDKDFMLQGSLDLQMSEKSFYEAIGKNYPPSPNQRLDYSGQDLRCPNGGFSDDFLRYDDGRDCGRDVLVDGYQVNVLGECCNSTGEVVESFLFYQTAQSISTSANSVSSDVDGLVESLVCSQQVPGEVVESVSSFIKGVEEASKLIPNCDQLIVSAQASEISKNLEEKGRDLAAKVVKKDDSEEFYYGLKGKKHLHEGVTHLEEEGERSCKQAASCSDPNVHSDIFDEVLLHHAGDQNKAIVSLRETLQTEVIKKTQQNGQSKGSSCKGRGRKQIGKKEAVDLRTLLISCAEAFASDDRRRANELLKQIRQHSSPFGDGNQRLAHCFADGLEARLAATGTQIYRNLISKRVFPSDVLKAYLLYLAACPFKKVSNFFSNKTISKLARGLAKIHIIDFGILYGFQWPTFFQRQSEKPGGPPKIRITGIDFPQPGFRPAERVEETGRRLAHYAEEFKVPFEFNSIAKRWETIQLEDLKLVEDELVVVNCIFRMKNLPDETMVVDSSRNVVLNMIRKINPAVFIQGVINGAYNAPFFLTRFREALFHFSTHFDMLETVVPREYEERMLIERDIFGREALNVVACEGWERVERPETYKQWQARTSRAGFVQLPLDAEIKDKAKLRVTSYHKDFVIDEDSQWLVLGWKGRITHALSTWKPG